MILLTYIISFCFSVTQILIPLNVNNRKDISKVKLTEIGQYGLMRKEKNGNPKHFHTGIDIKRPNNNYKDEPVFPICYGRVISKRTDGAYANLIVEHELKNIRFWTVYEHVAGIRVKVNDIVNLYMPIARFMNRTELMKYGWQFDHFHLEILKVKPMALKPDKLKPERYYNSYTLVCYTPDDLNKYFYNPVEFLKSNIH